MKEQQVIFIHLNDIMFHHFNDIVTSEDLHDIIAFKRELEIVAANLTFHVSHGEAALFKIQTSPILRRDTSEPARYFIAYTKEQEPEEMETLAYLYECLTDEFRVVEPLVINPTDVIETIKF